MATVRRRFVVSGRVQGVFYREGAKSEAQRLRLTGWARNLDDGSVEVVAEGDPTAVELLGRWLKQGPPRSAVTNIDAQYETPEGLAGFSIR
jgi:acylphosphatase